MQFTAQAEAPPLREDADGAVRVGDSRVLLELVVRAFEDDNIPHPAGSVDPARDAESMLAELLLNDLIAVERKLEKLTEERKKGGTECLSGRNYGSNRPVYGGARRHRIVVGVRYQNGQGGKWGNHGE